MVCISPHQLTQARKSFKKKRKRKPLLGISQDILIQIVPHWDSFLPGDSRLCQWFKPPVMDAMCRRQPLKGGWISEYLNIYMEIEGEGGSQGWRPCRNIKSISISVCHLQIIIISCTCCSAPVSLHERQVWNFSLVASHGCLGSFRIWSTLEVRFFRLGMFELEKYFICLCGEN